MDLHQLIAKGSITGPYKRVKPQRMTLRRRAVGMFASLRELRHDIGFAWRSARYAWATARRLRRGGGHDALPF